MSMLINATTQYAAVPQRDIDEPHFVDDVDVENQGAEHHHQHADPSPGSNNIPLVTSLDPDNPHSNVPHTHCDVCERRLEKREKRQKEIQCCALVSVTFIMAFFCIMLLGIVIVRSRAH